VHTWKEVEGADAARGASRKKERELKATEERRRSERECVSMCETGVVGKEEIETMDVSEQESEKKGVKVSERKRGYLRRKRKVLSFLSVN